MPPYDERRDFWQVGDNLKAGRFTLYRFGSRWSIGSDGRGWSVNDGELAVRLIGDTEAEAWRLAIGRARMAVTEAEDDLAAARRKLYTLMGSAPGDAATGDE